MTPALSIRAFRLPFRQPLATAHGERTAVEGLALRLDDGAWTGLGEVTPLPEFGTESLDEARSALEALAGSGTRLRAMLEGAAADLPHAASAGVEMAVLDLLSRRRALPLCTFLSDARPGRVRVNALLSALPVAALVVEARAALDHGFDTLKIKLGLREGAEDVRRLVAVREAVGRGVALRIDGNGAWTEREARARLEPLRSVGLEYCEQPVAAEDVEGLGRLRALVRVAADESLGLPDGLERVLAGPSADVLILKLPALGGCRAALRASARGGARGLDCVLTSALDGAVGRAAAAHVARVVDPEARLAHGLGSGALLAADPGALPIVGGWLEVPDRPGLGIAPEDVGW